MTKKLDKETLGSIILYVFAVLLLLFTLWAFVYCTDIISQAKASGQLTDSGNKYDIVSFYMGNCGQYFVYSLLLAAAGLLLQQKKSPQTGSGCLANEADMEDTNPS